MTEVWLLLLTSRRKEVNAMTFRKCLAPYLKSLSPKIVVINNKNVNFMLMLVFLNSGTSFKVF